MLYISLSSSSDSETVSLPETDPEAIAFLAKQKEEAVTVAQPPPTSSPPASGPGAPAATTTMPMPEPAQTTAESAQAKASEISTLPTPSAPTAPATKPAAKGGPPRRKPRQSLEAMASALGKGKKMTTFEKVRPAPYNMLLGADARCSPSTTGKLILRAHKRRRTSSRRTADRAGSWRSVTSSTASVIAVHKRSSKTASGSFHLHGVKVPKVMHTSHRVVAVISSVVSQKTYRPGILIL